MRFCSVAFVAPDANMFSTTSVSVDRSRKTSRDDIPTDSHSGSLSAKPSSTIRQMSESAAEPRKAGVASPPELRDFVAAAGDRLLVVDARHPDPTVEPGDAKSLAVAGFPDGDKGYRPQAVNLPWSRADGSMDLPDAEKDTPIITHCGGGGRGQKAKDFLEKNGFTNVLNGGGPKETECWAEFGDK